MNGMIRGNGDFEKRRLTRRGDRGCRGRNERQESKMGKDYDHARGMVVVRGWLRRLLDPGPRLKHRPRELALQRRRWKERYAIYTSNDTEILKKREGNVEKEWRVPKASAFGLGTGLILQRQKGVDGAEKDQ